MERWIVLSNCQTRGLTNCLALQNPDVDITPCEVWSINNEPERWAAELEQFDRIFLTDEILRLEKIDFSRYSNVMRVPDIEFGGYHPDICYVWTSIGHIQTPLSDYHSIICLAAYQKGLSESDTRALYNQRTYQAGGYFDSWHLEKLRLFERFKSYDFDLSAEFRRWSMRTNFMYSLNHPRIDCLYDIAQQITRRLGREPRIDSFRPHDNMANGAVFPVYDEIAESFGIEGSYNFKPGDKYRFISLEEYIAGCFASYSRFPKDILFTTGIFQDRYNAVFNAI